MSVFWWLWDLVTGGGSGQPPPLVTDTLDFGRTVTDQIDFGRTVTDTLDFGRTVTDQIDFKE